METQHKAVLRASGGRLRRPDPRAARPTIRPRPARDARPAAAGDDAPAQPRPAPPPCPRPRPRAPSETGTSRRPLDEVILDYLVESARRAPPARSAARKSPRASAGGSRGAAPAARRRSAPSCGPPSACSTSRSRTRAGTFALRDVSVEIGKGEFVFLTGPSGAGKTTLMRLIFAAERPSEGQILVLGRNVARLGRAACPRCAAAIGVVFQDFKLLPRAHRRGERRAGARRRRHAAREVRARVFAMLKRVGLQHRRFHHPLSLSGGEQQRVAHRARARERARDPARRRAHRQPRPRAHARDHGADRRRRGARHDGARRHPRDRRSSSASASGGFASRRAASPRTRRRPGAADAPSPPAPLLRALRAGSACARAR